MENGYLREGVWSRKFTGVMVCTLPASRSGPDRGHGPAEPLGHVRVRQKLLVVGNGAGVLRKPGECSAKSCASSVELLEKDKEEPGAGDCRCLGL